MFSCDGPRKPIILILICYLTKSISITPLKIILKPKNRSKLHIPPNIQPFICCLVSALFLLLMIPIQFVSLCVSFCYNNVHKYTFSRAVSLKYVVRIEL